MFVIIIIFWFLKFFLTTNKDTYGMLNISSLFIYMIKKYETYNYVFIYIYII